VPMNYFDIPYIHALTEAQRDSFSLLPQNPLTSKMAIAPYETYYWARTENKPELKTAKKYFQGISRFIQINKDDPVTAPYADHYIYAMWGMATSNLYDHKIVEMALQVVQPFDRETLKSISNAADKRLLDNTKLPFGSYQFGLSDHCRSYGKVEENFSNWQLTDVNSTCSTFIYFKNMPECFKGFEVFINRDMAMQLAKPKARHIAHAAINVIFEFKSIGAEFAHDLLMRSMTFREFDTYMAVQLEKTGVTPKMMHDHLGPLDEMVNFQLNSLKGKSLSGSRGPSFIRFLVAAIEHCEKGLPAAALSQLAGASESIARGGAKDAVSVIQAIATVVPEDDHLSLLASLHVLGADKSDSFRRFMSTEQGRTEFEAWTRQSRLGDGQLFKVCQDAGYVPKNARTRKAKQQTLRNDLGM
jgi:hypothetical protein